MPEATLYEVAHGAAWITLNRPENRNALSAALVSELDAHLTAANADPAVRCIVITGADPAFCAGADLKSPPGQSPLGDMRAVTFPDVLQHIMDSDKPVIAAIALGGPLAVIAAKKLVRQVATLPPATAFAEMARLSASMFVSPEGQEGMAAFREKRAPAWVRMEDQP